MAEKLPRYRPLGVSIASVPAIDFAGAKMEARGYAQTQAALDKISSFAFSKAAEVAAVRGEEYGAQYAPTAQQIQDAASGNETLSLPGDEFTVFGKAARKSALATAADELELQGRSQISQLQLLAEEGKIDPATFNAEVSGVIDGLAGSIEGVSASASRTIRAKLGVIGNSALVVASRKFEAKVLEQQKVQNTYLANASINALPDIFEAGDSVAPNGDVVTFWERAEASKDAMVRRFVQSGDEDGLKAFLSDYNEKIQEIRVAVFSEWAASADTADDDVASFVFEDKIVPGTKLSRFLENADSVEIQQIKENVYSAFKKKNDLFDRDEQESRTRFNAYQRTNDISEIAAFSANPGGFDANRLRNSYTSQRLSPAALRFFDSELKRTTEVTENNSFTWNELYKKIHTDKLDAHDDILYARTNDQLTLEMTVNLLRQNSEAKTMRGSFEKTNIDLYRDLLKRRTGISKLEQGLFSFGTEQKDAFAQQRAADALFEFETRIREGEPVDLVTDDIIERYTFRAGKGGDLGLLLEPSPVPGLKESPQNFNKVKEEMNAAKKLYKLGQISKTEYSRRYRALSDWEFFYNFNGGS